MIAAVIDKSVALKRLRSIEELGNEYHTEVISQTKIDRNKNRIAESACLIINRLRKRYRVVIIPQAVVNEINDAATQETRLIFKRVLSICNVIVSYKPCDDIFSFAANASEEYDCPVDIITYDTDTYPGPRLRYTVTAL